MRKKLFKAALLASLILFGKYSYSQRSEADWRLALQMIQEGRDKADSLRAYKYLLAKQDSLISSLQREVTRKEGVIVRTMEQRNTCFAAKDTMAKQLNREEFVLRQQNELISAYETKKDKRFGIGFGVGYGMASVANKMGLSWTIGLNLSYQLIKF